MPSVFVTATDTGVGKTTIAEAILRGSRARGLDLGPLKPIESGCTRAPDGSLVPADARLLRAAAGDADRLVQVCPHRVAAPIAPGIGAAREGLRVTLDMLVECCRTMQTRHPDGVVVEGAGGWEVPLTPAFDTVADLATRLQLPVLVVARNALGTLNHTTLTVRAIRDRGLHCLGIVLNRADPDDPSHDTNARALERLTGIPVLAQVPAHHDRSDSGRIPTEALARVFDAMGR